MEVHRLALPKGFRLANYELTRVLGKGGFGITYLGVDRHLGRKVAVKELMPDSIVARIEGMQVVAQSEELKTNWEWAKGRFLEEARVLASFQHPNIVEVHQLIEANGTVYMVMDYIEGESYEARLRRINHEPDEHSMRQLIEPLMDGLEEVHSTGLLHRDIKPDNILLRRDIQPILIDFGSARKLLEGTSVMTSLVTHGYSPIEQYQVKTKQGPWTDIYALAAVATRAITGEKPPMSADRMSDDDFVWLSYRELKGFSPLFLQALDWALRVKPSERPQNIREWRTSFGWEARGAFRGKPFGSVIESGDKTALIMGGDATTPAPKKFSQRIATAQVRPIAPPPVPGAAPALAPIASVAPKPVPAPVTTGAPAAADAGGDKMKFLPTLVAGVLLLGGGWFLYTNVFFPPSGASSTHVPDSQNAPVKAVPHKPAPYTPVVNSLGMKFAPVAGIGVLFSVWDVRVKDYRAFVQETGREWRSASFPQTLDDPALNVSWEDAKAFCQWLSARDGREYRLPTDAEWSVAVGLKDEGGGLPHDKDGRVKGAYPWGTAWPPPPHVGNYGASRLIVGDSFEKTSPVGSFPENAFGLFDMGGNVWQWCEDSYDDTGRRRVLRGGAWNSSTQDVMLSSFRYYAFPGDSANNIGFRCVTPASGTAATAP
ncbi:MAG: SUMF1/EgtB/PvdO family nonheme iron enzyme [Chthoniobacteraceae bacterium]